MSVATPAAFAGAVVGKRLLKKVTIELVHQIVGGLLILIGVGMISGLL